MENILGNNWIFLGSIESFLHIGQFIKIRGKSFTKAVSWMQALPVVIRAHIKYHLVLQGPQEIREKLMDTWIGLIV